MLPKQDMNGKNMFLLLENFCRIVLCTAFIYHLQHSYPQSTCAFTIFAVKRDSSKYVVLLNNRKYCNPLILCQSNVRVYESIKNVSRDTLSFHLIF